MKKEGKDNIIHSTLSGNFDISLDLTRLASLISLTISPKHGHLPSLNSMRNLISSLKQKQPKSWENILSTIISQCPEASFSWYNSILYGEKLLKDDPDLNLNLNEKTEEALTSLHSNLDHPKILDYISAYFKSLPISQLFSESFSKGPEDFSMFLTLFHLYDQQELLKTFQEFIDRDLENKSIEYLVEFLENYETSLRTCPSGKLLHMVYQKLSSLLSGSKGAKSLAEFCHQFLTKKTIPPKCSNLYVLCQQKDLFEKYYLELCVDRLLRYSNFPQEKETCETIKETAGPDSMENVASLIESTLEHKIEFDKMNVVVAAQRQMNTAVTPAELEGDFIAKELKDLAEKYCRRFVESFPKKTLKFQYLTGIIELQYGECIIICNFIQACILLLFNLKKSWKKEEILEKFKYSSSLKELAEEEVKTLEVVLVRAGEDLEVDISEKRSYDFTKKNQEEVKNEKESMDEARKPIIECAVVRILKKNRQLDIDELTKKLKEILKFVPKSDLIDDRLKNLELKGYIWRVENSCGYIP